MFGFIKTRIINKLLGDFLLKNVAPTSPIQNNPVLNTMIVVGLWFLLITFLLFQTTVYFFCIQLLDFPVWLSLSVNLILSLLILGGVGVYIYKKYFYKKTKNTKAANPVQATSLLWQEFTKGFHEAKLARAHLKALPSRHLVKENPQRKSS